MSYFSWNTSDTQESIPCVNSDRATFTVYLLSPDGRRWEEKCYQGDGVFGGKDAYALAAELNSRVNCSGNVSDDRLIGVSLTFDNSVKLDYPIKIVRSPTMKYSDVEASSICGYQGKYYPMEE